VKIKITEYFPGARAILGQEVSGLTGDAGDNFFAQGEHFGATLQSTHQPQAFGVISHTNENLLMPGSNGERFFTIQRVNGNGGNGKGDGVAGPHKHTLADSDRVKKNSIQRQLLKDEKEMKKLQVRFGLGATFVLIFVPGLAGSFKQRHTSPLRNVIVLMASSPLLNLASYHIVLNTGSTSCSCGNTCHT